MNEFEILKKLASNLTERRSIAALSNYEVLCNNISFSHDLFDKGVKYLTCIISDFKKSLDKNDSLRGDYRIGEKLNPLTSLVPILLTNDLAAIKKLLLFTESDHREEVDIGNVGNLHKGFVEYNNLVTATRQLVDSLVTDAYQIQIMDPKEFNYHILLSLNSFESYATKSIHRGLFNDEINEALREFRKLKPSKWSDSAITRCQRLSFANKLDYLFSSLKLTKSEDDAFKDEIKKLFKFSSDFTHIGYASTFFTSHTESQPIFGSAFGPYLPSTENYNELKYQILESCINLFLKIYIPSIGVCMNTIFMGGASSSLGGDLGCLRTMLKHGIESRNNNYFFFICSHLIGSKETIELPCICNRINQWHPPHHKSELFCRSCGSSYNIIAIPGDSGYVFTSYGPSKVIGSTVPDFRDLSSEEQQKLLADMDVALNNALSD